MIGSLSASSRRLPVTHPSRPPDGMTDAPRPPSVRPRNCSSCRTSPDLHQHDGCRGRLERNPDGTPVAHPCCGRRFPDPDPMFAFIDFEEGPESFWQPVVPTQPVVRSRVTTRSRAAVFTPIAGSRMELVRAVGVVNYPLGMWAPFDWRKAASLALDPDAVAAGQGPGPGFRSPRSRTGGPGRAACRVARSRQSAPPLAVVPPRRTRRSRPGAHRATTSRTRRRPG